MHAPSQWWLLCWVTNDPKLTFLSKKIHNIIKHFIDLVKSFHKGSDWCSGAHHVALAHDSEACTPFHLRAKHSQRVFDHSGLKARQQVTSTHIDINPTGQTTTRSSSTFAKTCTVNYKNETTYWFGETKTGLFLTLWLPHLLLCSLVCLVVFVWLLLIGLLWKCLPLMLHASHGGKLGALSDTIRCK